MQPPEEAYEPLPKLRSMASDSGVYDGVISNETGQAHGARMRHPLADSASSLEHLPEISSQIYSTAPIFFMHGVGLGLVRPVPQTF